MSRQNKKVRQQKVQNSKINATQQALTKICKSTQIKMLDDNKTRVKWDIEDKTRAFTILTAINTHIYF